ncbi:MAG TPA: FecR family protein [bacterium]|nr:FecR family protein [bacterium]
MRLLTALTVMCVAAAGFLSGVSAPVSAEPCPAFVAGVVGDVQFREADENDWEPVELDMCLYVGDQIRTMKDSLAALKMEENVEVRVNAFSVFKVGSLDKDKKRPNQLDMKKGEAWAKVSKIENKETAFEIRTPTAQAGVRGTEFNVEVDEEGGTKVNVLEGAVRIFNELGEVLAEAGMFTEVLKGKIPLDPAEFDIEAFKGKLDAWKGQISIGEVKEAMKQKIEEKKDEVKNNVKGKFKF